MKLFMNMRIGARLTLLITAVVVAVFALTIVVTIRRVNALASGDARRSPWRRPRRSARSVQTRLNVAMDNARTLANIFESAATVDGMKLTRRKANMMLKYFIEKNTAFPDVWAVFEPNAFDGNDANFKGDVGTDETGRFIPTWSRDKNGDGVLEANKDYETAGPGDYYQVPRTRKRESVDRPVFVHPERQAGAAQLLRGSRAGQAGEVPRGRRRGPRPQRRIQAMVASIYRSARYNHTYVNLMSANGRWPPAPTRSTWGRPSRRRPATRAIWTGCTRAEQFEMQRFSRTLNDNGRFGGNTGGDRRERPGSGW